jgi:hypothetical protein
MPLPALARPPVAGPRLGSAGRPRPRAETGTRVASLGAWTLVLLLPAVAVASRLPFLRAPLTADEGGYAEIARLWSHGSRLYQDVWVDRPQGLILAFRALRALGLGSTAGLRAAAAGIAVLALAGTALVALRLCGRRAAVVAAVLVATAGASPSIESFTLTGELLASVPVLASMLAFIRYLGTRRPAWLAAAGVLSGLALTVKQSAFDAMLAALAFLLLREGRRGLRAAALLTLSTLLPPALAAAAAGAPGRWWFAVVGYRGLGNSVVTSPPEHQLAQLASSLPAAALALALPAALAVVGWSRAPLLARLWLGAAALGVAGGGSYHAHYWQQLVAPLCVLAGAGGERLLAARPRAALVAVGLAAAAVAALPAPLWSATGRAQAAAVWPDDPHLETDAAVAAYVDRHTAPGQPVLVLWAAADVYYLADRPPAARYLWSRNLETIPGALAAVRELLAARRPALVIAVQRPASLDPSGETGRILRRRYQLVARVRGVPVYRPVGPGSPT